MQLFDRVAVAIIGLEGNAKATQIEGLRMSFRVEKSTERSTNRCELDIWNLSADSRGLIELWPARGSGNAPDHILILKAGYAQTGGPVQIFRGDIVQMNHRQEPPDIITHIEAEDGQKALRQMRLSMSFEAEFSAMHVLDHIVAALKDQGLDNWKSSQIGDKPYNHGFSFTGPAVEALDKVTRYLNARWKVVDHQLQIYPLLYAAPQAEAVLISPGTGMIASPERLVNIGGVLTPAEDQAGPEQNQVAIMPLHKEINGYRVRSLLQPDINPFKAVRLESQLIPKASGFFLVEKLEHQGDTHGELWETTLEVTEPWPNPVSP